MTKSSISLIALGIMLTLSACQTSGPNYTSSTVPIKPQRSNLSEAEYAVKLTAHLFPRKCITYKYFSTTGYDKNGPKNKVSSFDMHRLEKNSLENGWYNTQVSSPFASGKIYVNTNSAQIVCGRNNWLKKAEKENIQGNWNLKNVDIAKLLNLSD